MWVVDPVSAARTRAVAVATSSALAGEPGTPAREAATPSCTTPVARGGASQCRIRGRAAGRGGGAAAAERGDPACCAARGGGVVFAVQDQGQARGPGVRHPVAQDAGGGRPE